MSRKNVLILRNVSANQVLLRYYHPKTLPDEIPQTPVEPEIDLNDLLKDKSSRCVTFFDNHKQKVKYWVNMIDVTQGMALPLYTTKSCWWHRTKITSRPLGIPVRYSPQKDKGLEKDRVEQRFKEMNLSSDSNDFFETIGMVCSFPCMKAYILEQLRLNRGSRFKESLTLMTLLYSKMFGKVITIPTAPTWKILRPFGGHLTPEEYTNTFGKLQYDESVNLRRPYMFSSSGYIQENLIRF